MDMQEIQSPVFGVEDPSLPWPDSDEMVLTMRSEPVVAACASCAPDHDRWHDQRQDHRHDQRHDYHHDQCQDHRHDQRHDYRHDHRHDPMDKRWDEGRRGDMERMEKGRTELPTCDSIDPRLLSLAMAFVPYQPWEKPYEFDVALRRGTIFPSLDMPWMDEEARRR